MLVYQSVSTASKEPYSCWAQRLCATWTAHLLVQQSFPPRHFHPPKLPSSFNGARFDTGTKTASKMFLYPRPWEKNVIHNEGPAHSNRFETAKNKNLQFKNSWQINHLTAKIPSRSWTLDVALVEVFHLPGRCNSFQFMGDQHLNQKTYHS